LVFSFVGLIGDKRRSPESAPGVAATRGRYWATVLLNRFKEGGRGLRERRIGKGGFSSRSNNPFRFAIGKAHLLSGGDEMTPLCGEESEKESGDGNDLHVVSGRRLAYLGAKALRRLAYVGALDGPPKEILWANFLFDFEREIDQNH